MVKKPPGTVGFGIVQMPAVEAFTGVPPLELLEPLLLPDDEDDAPEEELLDDEPPLDEVEPPELLPDDDDPLEAPLLVLEPDDEVEDDEEPPEVLELDKPLLDELDPDELLLGGLAEATVVFEPVSLSPPQAEIVTANAVARQYRSVRRMSRLHYVSLLIFFECPRSMQTSRAFRLNLRPFAPARKPFELRRDC
jgi:hypothetical protein